MTPLFRSIHILIDYVRVIVVFLRWVIFSIIGGGMRFLAERDLLPTVFFAAMAIIALYVAFLIAE